jgi:hypothetical protein
MVNFGRFAFNRVTRVRRGVEGRKVIHRPYRGASVAVLLLLVGGCSSYAPTALVLPSGEILRGESTALVTGYFTVHDDRVSCTGSFGRTVHGYNISVGRKSAVYAACSNGQSATSTDDLSVGGEARLQFAQGKEGRILVGEAARNIAETARTRPQ